MHGFGHHLRESTLEPVVDVFATSPLSPGVRIAVKSDDRPPPENFGHHDGGQCWPAVIVYF